MCSSNMKLTSHTLERIDMERATLITSLLEDYADYLEDFDTEDLEFIVDSGYFTMREARKQHKLGKD